MQCTMLEMSLVETGSIKADLEDTVSHVKLQTKQHEVAPDDPI